MIRLQLNWPGLLLLLGEQTLEARTRAIDTAWLVENLDQDAQEAYRQAVRYADDPEAGERDRARWVDRGGWDEDED